MPTISVGRDRLFAALGRTYSKLSHFCIGHEFAHFLKHWFEVRISFFFLFYLYLLQHRKSSKSCASVSESSSMTS